MKRGLLVILLILLVIVGTEFAYLHYLTKTRFKTKESNLEKVVTLPSYKQYHEWQPNEVASIINPFTNKLEYNVRALIRYVDMEKNQVEALSGDNKTYLFQITPQTIFYTVTILPNQPPIQKQEGSFEELKEGRVVLFTWRSEKEEESLDKPILASSVMIKK